jgi:REP element-mobilizing transposase RayT
MARPWRVDFPNAIHHVTARGDRREPIVTDDRDRRRLFDVIGEALDRFDACALAYCFMNNHYHIVLQTRRGNLGRVMRHINGVYTQAFNRRHEKSGHVFQGRYWSALLNADAYLLKVCTYVDLNPVRAALVPRASDWRWSSHRALIGAEPPPAWLDVGQLLGNVLGRSPVDSDDWRDAASLYAKAVDSDLGLSPWPRDRRRCTYLGDSDFFEKATALAAAHRARAADRA